MLLGVQFYKEGAVEDSDDIIILDSDLSLLNLKEKNSTTGWFGVDGGVLIPAWLPGHPLKGKDCAALSFEGSQFGMISTSCEAKRKAFACEKKGDKYLTS